MRIDSHSPVVSPEDRLAISATQAWLQHAVIGLNLCPFAKAVATKNRVRYAVSDARDPEALLADLCEELHHLADADPEAVETSLLIHPHALNDFNDFADFLSVVEAAVHELGYEGELQVASFHPAYQFDGTAPEDISNATNRAPYPTLHVLREESIDRAVEAYPDPDAIYEANIDTLERLGPVGWAALQQQWVRPASDATQAPGTDSSPTAP